MTSCDVPFYSLPQEFRLILSLPFILSLSFQELPKAFICLTMGWEQKTWEDADPTLAFPSLLGYFLSPVLSAGVNHVLENWGPHLERTEQARES